MYTSSITCNHDCSRDMAYEIPAYLRQPQSAKLLLSLYAVGNFYTISHEIGCDMAKRAPARPHRGIDGKRLYVLANIV